MFTAAIIGCLILNACKDDETTKLPPPYTATPQAFDNLIDNALENRTQRFSEDIQNGWLYVDTNSGGYIWFGSSLYYNGTLAQGTVDIEFIEMYDKGSMLVTDKPTMATEGDSEVLLVSGGEFYINATQNGSTLFVEGNAKVTAPYDLTGGLDPGMARWTGVFDNTGNITWQNRNPWVSTLDSLYDIPFNSFGWINCDDFPDDPRPRIRAFAQAPEGYNGTNSRIYLSVNGESYALGRLRFDDEAGFFGGISIFPSGLECHLIFATEYEGNWRYAIKAATLQEDDVIGFEWEDTTIATEEELVDIVNGLP